MALQHTVARGDSLWGLAHRYLGDGSRWPVIRKYHNEQAARFNSHSQLMPIKDNNLIYVGQTIKIPSRTSTPDPGTGQRGMARTLAREIELTIKYIFGNGEAPIVYVQENSECIVKTEMRGSISIEMASPEQYQHNLDLLLAKDAMHCKKKLNEIYAPAFRALTEKPEIVFKANTVTIIPKGTTNTNLKSYMVKMSPKDKSYMTGNLKTEPVTGAIEIKGRKFNFKTDIDFLVEVKIKSDQFVAPTQHHRRSFISGLFDDLEQAADNVYNTFTDKRILAEIGQGFWKAGKISVLAHTGTALKAYAIFDVATGGPVTTTAMVAAGTPTGQKILVEFIPSMNPGTLPSPTEYGFWGWLTGTLIENEVRKH